MKIINKGRGSGKTTMLISAAYVTGMPIICNTYKQKENIMNTAMKMGLLNGVEFYTVEEWMRIRGRHNEDILIDNVDLMIRDILNKYLDANVVACTMSIPMDNCLTIK